MDLSQSVLLGIIQGLTEFLPVSSSGHLAIAQHYMEDFHQPGVLYDVLVHVATVAAVLLYFRREVAALLSSPFRKDEKAAVERRLLVLLAAGSVPTAIMGLLMKDLMEELFANIALIALMLVVTGCLLFVSEKLRGAGRKEEALTLSDALLVGVAQGCAIIPGISRSGATISVLLIKGVDGETAARFSFLLAIPAILGAALLSLKDFQRVPAGQIPAYAAGAAAAFVVGLISIHLLLAVVRRRRLFAFAIYCCLAGATFFALNV
jgi:undecaprenyl-diphosphatase